MLLATNTGNVMREFAPNAAVDLFHDAGFSALDFSFFDEKWYIEGIDPAFFRDLGTYAKDECVPFVQAHAPFHSSFPDAAQTESRFQDIVRSMRYAALLGVQTIVVHPVQHLTYADDGVPERLFEMNMDFYGRLIPYCEEWGIRVGVENMWQYRPWPKISHSTCSTPEEMIRYVDTLNSPWVTGCLDTGHASLVGQAPHAFVRSLGAGRLGSLHVHDVSRTEDSHTLPYLGVMDWNQFALALKDIGYEGDLTFECDGFFKKLPSQLYPEALRLLAQTGRQLMDLMG